MDRRSFLTTTTLGAASLAFPAVLRAQSKDPIRIGVPLPLTGPSAPSPPTCSAAPSSPRSS
jgi:hypothetical protein